MIGVWFDVISSRRRRTGKEDVAGKRVDLPCRVAD